MCFGALTTVETCTVCGRRHPGEAGDRCAELRAAAEVDGLEQELARYLESSEAAFFGWLARRDAA